MRDRIKGLWRKKAGVGREESSGSWRVFPPLIHVLKTLHKCGCPAILGLFVSLPPHTRSHLYLQMFENTSLVVVRIANLEEIVNGIKASEITAALTS